MTRGRPEVDVHFMIGFSGTRLPPETRDEIAAGSFAGATLFRFENVDCVEQVRALTEDLQAANRSRYPLLIAADQETGQLQGLGAGTTAFPGAMALGATRDPDLARRVGRAIGRECLALGVNVNYAPVCDVATRADNPSLGIRSFGDDPELVAALATAMASGMLDVGVVPVLKHFPGKGEAGVDPHYELPVLDLDIERLEKVELAPFRAAIRANAPAVMVGHYGLPAITGRRDLPASVSGEVVEGLLRRSMGFDGVVITDALDMGAFAQAVGAEPAVVAALRAGVDLLLCSADGAARRRMMEAVAEGIRTIDSTVRTASRSRIDRLRQAVATADRPGLDAVGCHDHVELAREVASRSITAVRSAVLPLQPAAGDRILAVMPTPTNVTPADTSSTVSPTLAVALRRHHHDVTEVIVSPDPSDAEIDSVVDVAGGHSHLVVGTIGATERQAALVRRLIASGKPTVTAALRTPYDLHTYPMADTHLLTYSIHRFSMDALADVIFGLEVAAGSVPVAGIT
ncbi:MAG: glycoside hydrolase family 3 protein [Acidimicrobiia bacterium]|nr:glycoside hydrolase family 3 protein [Acidimicrobiia bacterium]MDH5293486.1 glycoside hydrolase family 3 protein [Acidimicrobiia bacterium]